MKCVTCYRSWRVYILQWDFSLTKISPAFTFLCVQILNMNNLKWFFTWHKNNYFSYSSLVFSCISFIFLQVLNTKYLIWNIYFSYSYRKATQISEITNKGIIYTTNILKTKYQISTEVYMILLLYFLFIIKSFILSMM